MVDLLLNKNKKYESIRIDFNKRIITLPKLKEVKFRGYRITKELVGKIKLATISKDANKYFVSVFVKMPFINITLKPKSIVGLDLGIKDFIVTSNGEKIKNEVKINEKIIIKYPVYVAIGVACYAFYITIDSIIKLIKYRKFKSPLIMSSRVINIVTSLISMLSLEVVMLSTFGADNVEFNEIMIMATGGGISIIIISICIYMIINVAKYLDE